MTDRTIDLRSDTFTVPDARMRAAMAGAEVGDDVWGEDPTVNRLEERIASLLGKASALFTPSGTMANLCAVLAHTGPGDEVVADLEAHVVVYEVAGAAVVGGVQMRTIDFGEPAVPTPEQVSAAARAQDIHQPVSRLLLLENTHNRRGGVAVEAARIDVAAGAAHAAGMRVHCDGARLFNAAVALGVDAARLVTECDSVSVCFSKGLGAPVGSALAGDPTLVAAARRWRKRLGGGMRQAGILAAAALDALDRNVARLTEDHDHARLLADAFAGLPGVETLRPTVPTNIVMLRTARPAGDVAAEARAVGVLVTPMGLHLVRLMTYLGISRADAEHAAAALRPILSGVAEGA